jgi:hypothetical protein
MTLFNGSYLLADGTLEYSPLFTEWLNLTLAISNISESYQICLNTNDENLIAFYEFIRAYKSVSNYLIYGIPNLLSYSFVVNQWMDEISVLQDNNDTVGLVYIYSLIIRRLVFYDIANITEGSGDLVTNFTLR